MIWIFIFLLLIANNAIWVWFWRESKVQTAIEPTALEKRAAALVAFEEKRSPDASGEFKRHRVLAKLMDEFPQAAKRDISAAIEKGLPE